MADLSFNLFSIALYVLQALGLYTIAQRRGIRNPWLAWIPFGSAWILASIADDYKSRRTGRKSKLRIALLALSVSVMVLSVISLGLLFSSLSQVLTMDEIMEFAEVASGQNTDLYTPSEDELIEQMAQKLETRLEDVELDAMMSSLLAAAVVGLVLGGVAIAAAVIECICMHSLFESCDPANKLVFFLVGLFIGIWAVFVFVVRNKDLGMPQALPGGFEQTPPREPWEQ